MNQEPITDKHSQRLDRRDFLKTAGALVTATATASSVAGLPSAAFPTADSLVLPKGWESLNPGYWQVRDGRLRRRLNNLGDRARRTGFPFHSATKGGKMAMDYDPSLPQGIIYRNDWKLADEYSVECEFTYIADRPAPAEGDDPSWNMYRNGYGRLGIAIGSQSLFESFGKVRNTVQIVWGDDGRFQIVAASKQVQQKLDAAQSPLEVAFKLNPGDNVKIVASVSPATNGKSNLTTTISANGVQEQLSVAIPSFMLHGYTGVTSRGLLDFEVVDFEVKPENNTPLTVPDFDCFVCYPLGDSLKQVNGNWQCRFVSLFASDGDQVQVRVADSSSPVGGWAGVPVAGDARIVNHEWRRNTAVVTVTLPFNPAATAMYYTVWKDGIDVTPDSRIGTDMVGPGTGLVGDVPADGGYVGRLPQLTAPYKLCGLSCHAITSGLQQRTVDGWKINGGSTDWQLRDQPTTEAYKHLEDYDFQVMVWEDDVWYMELVLYPPSTDDAYRVITNSICGPTSRWQMMRHWNVINPGDHDYGMDDVKGPEQLAIRRNQGLGQDSKYLQRNFQIVHHLVTGEAEVDPLANPKKWRAWKMPNRDFTFVIVDSRLWRSSQDTDMWDDAGWGAFQNLYDRTDPTRSLLGEEQFAWLQDLIHTDSSRLMCVTGVNGAHTVWGGTNYKGGAGEHIKGPFDQRDRVTADYAGWVKAGADRVLELLGDRDGVVSVYGDVHNGCIMKNKQHRVIECSFGPIGRSGGRAVIPGFGPDMKDFDGRELEVHSLYHKTYSDPKLSGHEPGAPFYWNFLEMQFDPVPEDPGIELRIRNLVDSPSENPRGGGQLITTSSSTGRPCQSKLPVITTLPNADVRFATPDGKPVRATRSDQNGNVHIPGLVNVEPGTQVLMVAFDGQASASQVFKTT